MLLKWRLLARELCQCLVRAPTPLRAPLSGLPARLQRVSEVPRLH
jgi:hypothetical protein